MAMKRTQKSVLTYLVMEGNLEGYTDIDLIKKDSIDALKGSSKVTMQVRRCIHDIQTAPTIERVQAIIFNSYLSFQGQKVL